jgi:hypothetical protein
MHSGGRSGMFVLPTRAFNWSTVGSERAVAGGGPFKYESAQAAIAIQIRVVPIRRSILYG